MAFERAKGLLWRRSARREHRQVVRRFYADGGDIRFRFDYDLDPSSIVLDVGGHEGQWASDLYARYRSRIYVFEPVRSFAQHIEDRFRLNPDITVQGFGLGGSTREEKIHVKGASSSVHRDCSMPEDVRIVDVEQWLKAHSPGRIALMKVNIEGGEFELLERLIETGLITTISNLQVQFHNFWTDAARRMESIQAALARSHELSWQYRFVWENWVIRSSGDR